MSDEEVQFPSSVTIGFPCGKDVPWQTAMSLSAATRAATKRGLDLRMQAVAGSSDVCDARNAVLTYFMESDSQCLFWIDSDIVFEAVDFLRLCALSTRYDVVAGVYPLKRDAAELVLNGAKSPYTMTREGLVKVDSLGLGFTIVSRAALEKLVAAKPRKYATTIGRELIAAFSREHHGEDITFFNDLRALGYDVWLDPTVVLGHVGPKVYKRDPAEALGISHVFRKE